MKKVAIVGLGWLGMPLAMSLSARGWQVTGSKTTQDGVEAARMSGIDSYLLRMEPELVAILTIWMPDGCRCAGHYASGTS